MHRTASLGSNSFSYTDPALDEMHLNAPGASLSVERTQWSPGESMKTRKLIQLPDTCRLDNCDVKDFELGVTCGTGSFSRVRHARLKATGEFVALKTLKKKDVIRLKQVDHVISEKAILKGISHPFIVSLHGSFQDERCLYFVLEFVPGGEFFTYLRRCGHLPERAAKFYAAQIVIVFEYLHQFKIVYRDLKPENILMDSRGYLKLTDFGFAKVVANYTYTLCGTPEYISPEVLLNKGHSTPADWWSLGIFIYEMLVGYPPFIADTTMGIYQKILAGRVSFPSRDISGQAKFLIRNLLTADLTKRYGNLREGVEEIKTSDWFLAIDWNALCNFQLPAPYLPVLKSDTQDTSNFEAYPDSKEESDGEEVERNDDPFADW